MGRPTNEQRLVNAAKELVSNQALDIIIYERREDLRDKWQMCTTTATREAVYHEVIALEELRDAIQAKAEQYAA